MIVGTFSFLAIFGIVSIIVTGVTNRHQHFNFEVWLADVIEDNFPNHKQIFHQVNKFLNRNHDDSALDNWDNVLSLALVDLIASAGGTQPEYYYFDTDENDWFVLGKGMKLLSKIWSQDLTY